MKNWFRKNNKESTAGLLEETVKLLREKAASMKGPYKDADTAIDSFFRAARDESISFNRPDDNTITAFLLGYANEEQKLEVAEALGGSRNFRLEIIQLAKDINAVKSVRPEPEDTVDQNLVEIKQEIAHLTESVLKLRAEKTAALDPYKERFQKLEKVITDLGTAWETLQDQNEKDMERINDSLDKLKIEIKKLADETVAGRHVKLTSGSLSAFGITQKKIEQVKGQLPISARHRRPRGTYKKR